MKKNLEIFAHLIRSTLDEIQAEETKDAQLKKRKPKIVSSPRLSILFAFEAFLDHKFEVPRYFNWFSFNKYACWGSCRKGMGIEDGLRILKQAMYRTQVRSKNAPAPHHWDDSLRVFLTSDAVYLKGNVRPRHIRGGIRRAKQYFHLARTEPCVVGVIGFSWQNFSDNRDSGAIGLEDPRMCPMRQFYINSGRCLLEKLSRDDFKSCINNKAKVESLIKNKCIEDTRKVIDKTRPTKD